MLHCIMLEVGRRPTNDSQRLRWQSVAHAPNRRGGRKRYLKRKKLLNERMRQFERNGMHATWAQAVPRSRWM